MDLKILCIIPARYNSKGLPQKNILLLNDKPLVVWSIKQAQSCNLFNEIIVSTDSQEILDISLSHGVKFPFLRPRELALDTTSITEVVHYHIDFFEKRNLYFDVVVLLEPTSPLRKHLDITKTLNLLSENYNKIDGVITISTVGIVHPYWTKKIENGFLVSFIQQEMIYYQRQQLPKCYTPVGGIFAIKTDVFKQKRSFYSNRIIPFVLEKWQSFSIDDLTDFKIVEYLFKENFNELFPNYSNQYSVKNLSS